MSFEGFEPGDGFEQECFVEGGRQFNAFWVRASTPRHLSWIARPLELHGIGTTFLGSLNEAECLGLIVVVGTACFCDDEDAHANT